MTQNPKPLRQLVAVIATAITLTFTAAIMAAWSTPAHAAACVADPVTNQCASPPPASSPPAPPPPGSASPPDDPYGNTVGGTDGSGETEIVPRIFASHAECVAYFQENYGDRIGEIESWECEQRGDRFVLRITWHKRKSGQPAPVPLPGTNDPACGMPVIPPVQPVPIPGAPVVIPAPQQIC